MEIQQKILVTAIIIKEGNILMQKRTDKIDTHCDKWTTPSGFVEINEHPQEAIIREVKEELNIEVEILSVIPSIDSFPNHKGKYHMIYIAYLCKYISGELKNTDQDGDISEVKWVSLSDIDTLPTIRGTMPPIDTVLKQGII
jgi:8-oxo-dGTP diphosphatase